MTKILGETVSFDHTVGKYPYCKNSVSLFVLQDPPLLSSALPSPTDCLFKQKKILADGGRVVGLGLRRIKICLS